MNRPWFKFWPKGVPEHIDYPHVPVFQLLIDSADKYSDKVALVYKNQMLTYSELNAMSDKFASALIDIGLRKGNRVMIFLPNVPEYVISYYGSLKAGAIVTAASPLFKQMELAFQLNDSGAETIITNESLYPCIPRKMRGLKNIIIVGHTNLHLGANEVKLFDNLCNRGKHVKVPIDSIDVKKEVAVLQYTSGSTGLPKGAMMTHYNLVANAFQNTKWFNWTEKDVVLAVLPFCHTWSTCVCINSPVLVGATIVLIEHFDPVEVLQVIESKRVTICYGSATMFNLLINCPEFTSYDLSSLRLVKVGAMPILPELKRKWDALTGIELILGYGLTEASPETHNSPTNRVKIGSVGIPIIDTDARIVDLETGTKDLPPGEIGELIIKGPQVTIGYWNNLEDTKRVLRKRWLYTGDIAKMDDEGYFYIVDRKKDLIKYKGYSVFPAELEIVLYEHPSVKECIVIGKPHHEVGEIPKAFIVVHKGMAVGEDEIIEFCASRLAPYKKIREVEFVNELPKTVTGKPLRRLLREGGFH